MANSFALYAPNLTPPEFAWAELLTRYYPKHTLAIGASGFGFGTANVPYSPLAVPPPPPTLMIGNTPMNTAGALNMSNTLY